MGRRTSAGGNKPPLFLSPSSFSSSFSKRSRAVRRIPSFPKPPLPPPAPPLGRRTQKKKVLARLWMRMDRRGGCEIFMCDKASVAERSGVHTRDLRVVGPLLSPCPRILAREKAMLINLEFIRAIVTTDEVLLLEPLAQEVLPFIDKLRRHFPLKSLEVADAAARHAGDQDGDRAKIGSDEREVTFEFQVLELALEAVCSSFNSSVADLNMKAIFVLEDLIKNVSTRNLERVRSLKRILTSLLAGVHKVRDEVEHLLDDNENMAQLHISKKLEKGNLEMLLEAYFMQLDGIRNRIVLVRGYIVDTEDYLNIQLDNQRNELLQFRLTLITASFGIAVNTLIAASFGMNIHNNEDKNTAVGLFWPFVGATSSFCLLLTIMLFGYAWRNKLLGS